MILGAKRAWQWWERSYSQFCGARAVLILVEAVPDLKLKRDTVPALTLTSNLIIFIKKQQPNKFITFPKYISNVFKILACFVVGSELGPMPELHQNCYPGPHKTDVALQHWQH
jgi:hypothetical protein